MSKDHDAPASVLVARELLRTPLVRTLLRDHLSQDTDTAPTLARALLEDDPQLALDLAAALPSRFNAAGQAAAELATALDRFPTPLTREAAGQWMAELDSEALEAQFGALFSSLWRHLWEDETSRALLLDAVGRGADGALDRLVDQLEQDPGAVTGPVEELAAALLEHVDIGRLRRAVELGAEAGAEPLARLIRQAMARPVVVANLVGCLPPAANGATRAAADIVDALDLPPEVLASALFNLLEALDRPQLARLINAVAARVEAAHRGNLILGRHEPRFLPLLQRLLPDLISRLDLERLEGAAAALAEDLETLLAAWSELARRRPELELGRLTGLLATVAAPVWPRVREAATRELPGRAGLLAAEATAVLVEALEQDPELVGRVLSEAMGRVEPDRLRRVITRSLEQMGEVFISRPEMREAVTGPIIAALQQLALDYMRSLGERIRGGGDPEPAPEKESDRRSAPRRLVGRIMGRGKKGRR